MTDIVVNAERKGTVGDLKFIHIQTTAAADDSHTHDLNSDATDGRGADMQEILNTLLQDDAGRDETATFDPATGIITFGNVNAAGIHNLLLVGR